MSIIAKNLVADGPDIFGQIHGNDSGMGFSSCEASPIYTTLDASVAVSGNYSGTGSYSGIDYDYSCTTSIAQQTRADLRSLIDSITANQTVFRDSGDTSYYDLGQITDIPSGQFAATLAVLSGINNQYSPFVPPAFAQSAFGTADGLIESIDPAGTRTDTNADPDDETDLACEITVLPPFFIGDFGVDLKMVVRITAVMNHGIAEQYTFTDDFEVDASTWDSADFRDIRGTYGKTSYDANGIEYVWSVTVG
jgi:hypothetical protein